MRQILIFLAVISLATQSFAADSKVVVQPNLAPNAKKKLDETLSDKLKQYDKSRTVKTYDDKYGLKIARDVKESITSENPALNDQIRKSTDFKKVYEGPRDATKEGKNLGFKLSIPLERD